MAKDTNRSGTKIDPFIRDLGKTLASIRKSSKLSQRQVGLRAGINKNSVGFIERGQHPEITVSTVQKYALALNYSLIIEFEKVKPVSTVARKDNG